MSYSNSLGVISRHQLHQTRNLLFFSHKCLRTAELTFSRLTNLHMNSPQTKQVGEGGIGLIVGFQPLMVISATASGFGGLCRCMRVSQYGPALFGPNDLRPTVFRCQATDSIQVSRKESLRPFILTPSHPVGCLTH